MMRSSTLPSRLARTGCSMLALATALVVGASPAAAQSFLGTGTYATNPNATGITTGPSSTTINLNAGQTVIDWIPNDNAIGGGPINFQLGGTTATFTGASDFAVLNNINQADMGRVISMNGTINSLVAGVPGGSVYFYSAGGFLLGANSLINVGSLVLSASPITVVGGNFITGANNSQVTFGQATNPLASIVTSTNTQINAMAGEAYVAMVAPRVQHGGTITVNGSAALVGAEAATIDFSPDGLFDIQVTVGTTDSQGVSTNGNITGSASAGAGDARRAFLVAVPKNTALTMAISSGADLGFQIAGAANVSGNAVILSAGHDIVDGEIGNVSAAAGALANLRSDGLNATSGVRAAATNFAEFYGGVGQANSFASDLDVRAPGRAWVSAQGAGSSIAIGRDVVLDTSRSATSAGESATGGSAFLYTVGNGAITVGRDATVTANGSGSGSSTAGIAGGAGTGGSAGIQNQDPGGTISITRDALVTANGTGGGGLVADANGGAGSGGFATIRSFADATSLTIGGAATAQARGTGGSALGCATCFGGIGSGGYVLADVQLGSTLSVAGLLRLNADGIGGSRAFGRGGTIDILAGTNSSLTAGSLNASADGLGGADVGAGAGNGTGGTARVIANGTGATITISNIVTTGSLNERDFISVEGRGGQTNGGGSGVGGTGQGGSALIQGLAGGSIAFPNTTDVVGVRVMVRGYGGHAAASGTTGGLGAAGNLNLSFDNGTFTAGPLHLSAAGIGGYAIEAGDITGGNGIGGTRNVTAVNGSTLSFAISGGVSGGGGGDGSGTGNGGNATGGFASLLVDNSTVNFTSRTNLVTQNQGGIGASGGNGTGGTSTVTIRNGGIVNVADDPSSTIDLAIGTFSYGNTGATGNGGNATAGSTTLNLQGGTINLTGAMLVGSEAYGGTASTSGTGGSATGGTVNANATGANNVIAGQGTATFSTDARGGSSATGTGGNATAGSTHLVTNSGASLNIASAAVVTATGFGGGGTAGGSGFGGTARMLANSGSSLSIGGLASIEADGRGGGGSSGNGGFGDGGLAVVSSAGGAISLANVNVRAAATGGSAVNGLGGEALGGSARLAANGGSILATGNLTLTASATGGTGSTGGNATALVSTMNESTPAAVAIYANTGGSVTINGGATFDGRATGGLGSNGNGGNAFAGEADVVAFVGTINVGALSIDVNGQGGAGGNGGNGGSGQGGEVDVAFGLDTPVIDGTITLGSATISADGFGGNGGTGLAGNFGGNGGAGGAGTGGGILFVGSAAGGTLDSGNASLTARGFGGRGGAGGNGDSGTGGNGGAGGAGTGSFIQTGSISQNLSPGSGGAARFSTLSINTSATGGNGGNGGLGGGGNGAGGSGGAAAGGRSDFLIRGVVGTANSVTLLANATGGNGGSGSTAGNGGNARTGFIQVESKDRFEVPTQRGTLTANSIVGSATAIGGSGAMAGTSTVMNGSYFRVLNGDANIGTVSIALSGTLNDSTFGPSFVSMRDGTATVGSLSFVTNGTLALDANNGSMNAGSFTLSAANFVPHVLDPAPTNIGTYFANSATITTGNNFVTNANLDIGGNLTILAPGLINAQNLTIGGNLDLSAGSGGITANNLAVTGAVNLDAFGAIGLNLVQAGSFDAGAGSFFTSGNITSGTVIKIDAEDDVTLGNLVAGQNADIDSNKAIRIITDGSVMVGNILAADGIDISALGSVTGLDVTTGGGMFTDALGAISYGDISAGLVNPQLPSEPFSVGLISGTSVTVGNVDASLAIGFATPGTLTTGSLTTGSDVLALVQGDMLIGDISADGRVFLADYTMYIDAGGTIPSNDEFDPEVIFAMALVPTSGSITVDGPVAAGSLQAATESFFLSGDINASSLIDITAGTSITVGAINAAAGSVSLNTVFSNIFGSTVTAGSLFAVSEGDITFGDLTAGGAIELVATGDIVVGNGRAGETIELDAGGFVDGGSMTAGDSIYVSAGSYVDLLGLSAGLVDPSSSDGADFNVGILAGTTINTGDIEAFNSIGLGAPGNIYTGNIAAGNIFLALGGGNLSFGTILADGVTYLADDSMIILGGDPVEGDFDPAPILASTPIASGGSITLRGPVTTGNFRAAAGTFVAGGDITSDTAIDIVASGDIALGNLVAGQIDPEIGENAIRLDAGGLIDVDNVTAIGEIDFEANGSITGNDITSGQGIYVEAEGAILFGNLSAGLVNPQPLAADADVAIGILSATSIAVGNVDSAESVGFVTLGSLDVETINTGGDVIALADGNMELGAIDADGRVYLANASIFVALEEATGDASVEDILNTTPVATGGSILTGPITAGRLQAAAGTTLTIDGDILVDTSVALNSGGAMLIESVDAGSSIALRSDASIIGDDLTAGSSVLVEANGAISLGNIVAGTGISTADVGAGSPVEIFTHGSIVTGNITTDGYVGLYAEGDVTAGTIGAGHDVITLVGDDASFGAITTPERFFLGGYAMTELVGGGEGFNPEGVFGIEQKIETGGSASFAGSSSTSSFEAYVGDATTIASLQTANFADIDTGGLFTLTGALNGSSRVISNDIDIGANGSINNGEIYLISRNPTQTLIGDGLDTLGQGYRLSDAEADRIHTEFAIAADTSYGAAAKMIIGDLSITAADDGGDDVEYEFETINADSDNPSVGSIKIVGDVVFNGLGTFDEVNFDTNLFALDAATGSISLFSQGTALGGELGLYAPRIWVASGAILAKLETNATYSGYITELNAPAAVQRPEGVLRAASLSIGDDDEPLQSLLVQNTGTKDIPAGFVIDESSFDDDGDEPSNPPGSVNLVINGQIVTPTGTLTGVAVRDLLVAEVGATEFAPGSTINGCPLTGECGSPPPPPVVTPTSADVALNSGDGLGDGSFGNEADIDDGESGDEGDKSSPIAPPNPLFDSRPLTDSADIDDPVSGSGNPSLYGSPDEGGGVGGGEDEDDDEDKKKKAKQGDGK